MLHTKMLVLGGAYEDDDNFSGIHFLPDVVWIGSANWTSKAETLNVEAAVAVAGCGDAVDLRPGPRASVSAV